MKREQIVLSLIFIFVAITPIFIQDANATVYTFHMNMAPNVSGVTTTTLTGTTYLIEETNCPNKLSANFLTGKLGVWISEIETNSGNCTYFVTRFDLSSIPQNANITSFSLSYTTTPSGGSLDWGCLVQNIKDDPSTATATTLMHDMYFMGGSTTVLASPSCASGSHSTDLVLDGSGMANALQQAVETSKGWYALGFGPSFMSNSCSCNVTTAYTNFSFSVSYFDSATVSNGGNMPLNSIHMLEQKAGTAGCSSGNYYQTIFNNYTIVQDDTGLGTWPVCQIPALRYSVSNMLTASQTINQVNMSMDVSSETFSTNKYCAWNVLTNDPNNFMEGSTNFNNALSGGVTDTSCTTTGTKNMIFPTTLLNAFKSDYKNGWFGLSVYPANTASTGTQNNVVFSQLDLVVSSTSPTFLITPTTGAKGTTISMTGNNFASTHTITFKLDGSTLTTSPSTVTSNSTGGFSSVTFQVPNNDNLVHTVNATDGTNWATATYTGIQSDTAQFRMMLSDGSAQIMTGRVIDTNSSTSETISLNGTGWGEFTGLSGNQNFTFIDNSNDFVVYKLINDNIASNIVKTVDTWEIPFNCVSPYTGFQSDFVFQTNDTDGHHITSITNPICINLDEVKFNVTYTANGKSSTIYDGLTRIIEGGSLFQPNPTYFDVNGTNIGTVQTTGVDILSNPYTVGSGLKTILNEFDILFQKTGTGIGGGSSGGPIVENNSTCFAGLYNEQTGQCQFGTINMNVTSSPISINSTTAGQGVINLQCNGAPYLTITNVNLGSNPLGFQIIGLPSTVNCGNTPSTCPSGSTSMNNQCVTNPSCPISSQLSNGACVGPLTCPNGSTLTNGQCIAPATCVDGSVPVGGQCPNNGNITVIAPPQQNGSSICSLSNPAACLSNPDNSCSLMNPLACLSGTTSSEPATITGSAPDGQTISAKTVISTITNPELNIVSVLFIILILGAVIGGYAYRYIKKKGSGKDRRSNGRDGNIRKFNENLRKK